MAPTKNSRFSRFLQEVSLAFALKAPLPHDNNACQLALEQEELLFLFEYDDSLVPETVLLSCEIREVVPEIYEAIALEALKANEQNEETLSFQLQSTTLYVHRRIHPDMPAKALTPLFEHFTHLALTFRKKIVAFEKSPPPPVTPSPFGYTFSLPNKKR